MPIPEELDSRMQAASQVLSFINRMEFNQNLPEWKQFHDHDVALAKLRLTGRDTKEDYLLWLNAVKELGDVLLWPQNKEQLHPADEEWMRKIFE